jgi:hypothetical protein
MLRLSRRHLLALFFTAGSAGCHLVRFSASEKEAGPSVADSLKATKPEGHPLDGPGRVGMKIATLIAPLKDQSIDEAIWRTSDEQVLPTDLRDSLRRNGIRIALLRSSLPSQVEELMKHSGPTGQIVEPLVVNQPFNEPVKIATAEPRPEISLLVDSGPSVGGKVFKDASGFFRVAGLLDQQAGVVLKVTPEIHHGKIASQIKPSQESPNPFAPDQLMIKSGQTEELFRDLAASVRIEPGQCLVIGLDSDREGGLGWFLLTDPPRDEKETRQKMILVWAWNANREASLKVPEVVRTNSREVPVFQPLQEPVKPIIAKRGGPDKTRDNAVQTAGFVKSPEKPAEKAKTKGSGK